MRPSHLQGLYVSFRRDEVQFKGRGPPCPWSSCTYLSGVSKCCLRFPQYPGSLLIFRSVVRSAPTWCRAELLCDETNERDERSWTWLTPAHGVWPWLSRPVLAQGPLRTPAVRQGTQFARRPQSLCMETHSLPFISRPQGCRVSRSTYWSSVSVKSRDIQRHPHSSLCADTEENVGKCQTLLPALLRLPAARPLLRDLRPNEQLPDVFTRHGPSSWWNVSLSSVSQPRSSSRWPFVVPSQSRFPGMQPSMTCSDIHLPGHPGLVTPGRFLCSRPPASAASQLN